MITASVEGFTKGLIERPYPLTRRGIPVLNSFYFQFDDGIPRVDNQLQYIMALPGGGSTDATPLVDLPPLHLDAGRVAFGFRDDDPNQEKDRYFYRASHVMIPRVFARRFQFRDVGVKGGVRRLLPPRILARPPHSVGERTIIALVGFKLFFTNNREHDIDQIAVMLEDDDIYTVALNDKNNDDEFGYQIDVVRISGQGLDIVADGASGSAHGRHSIALRRPTNTDFVLRGFNFDFDSRDRHLRNIGVVRFPDSIDIFFGDKTPDDPYRWSVKWAHVGEQVLDPVPLDSTFGMGASDPRSKR